MMSFHTETMNNARELERRGDLSGAASLYKSLLTYEEDRDVLLCLGAVLTRQGRLDEALEYYTRTLSWGENHLIHYNIGIVLYRKGELKKAVIHLEKASKINPSFMPALLVTGLCYTRLRNLCAAETCFSTVLNTLPYNRTALVSLAAIWAGWGRYDNALSLLDRALDAGGESRRLRELRAAVLIKAGRTEEWAGEIKAIAKSADGFRIFDDYISSIPVDIYTDKYGTMDTKIGALAARADRDPSCLISLSLCHLLKGDPDTAIDCLHRARKEMLN